jgi:hypothetical protein
MTELKANLPKGKQTALGLYVTAREAYEKWQAQLDRIKIVDVRTPEEFLFVGRPTMPWKIPFAAQSYEWDAEKKKVSHDASRGFRLPCHPVAMGMHLEKTEPKKYSLPIFLPFYP